MDKLVPTTDRQHHPPSWGGRMTLGTFTLSITLKLLPRQSGNDTSCHIDNRLAALRHEQGLTQPQFAHQLEVSPETLAALEDGSYLPSLALALRCSTLLHLPIETIFTYTAFTTL